MNKKFIRFHKNFNKLKRINNHPKNPNILKINSSSNFKLNNYYQYLKLCSINNKYNKSSRLKNMCLITGKYKAIFKQINLNRKFLKTFLLNNKVPNIKKIYW